MHGGLYTLSHYTLFAALLAIFGGVPAIWVARHAKQRDDAWAPWAALVLFTSVIGLVAYWEHVAIQRKRARRAAGGDAEEADH